MPKSHVMLVIVLLMALAVVFFAPSMNLEPTALRASRDAAMVILAIFIASHLFLCAGSLAMLEECDFSNRDASGPDSANQASLIDLYCTRLC